MNIIDPFVLPCLPLAWKHGLPKCPAVYFVIDKKQILYIGSSLDINSRWSKHNRLKDLKVFGSVRIAWFQVSDTSRLAKLEGEAIRTYKPFLNAWRRNRGDGTGHLRKRIVTKKGTDYEEYHYHYEIWDCGKCITKSSKYIPKRLVAKIQELESIKAPVVEILKLLGVD